MKRLLLLALVLSGCSRRDRIVVGAKNFTESDLLAEIVAQQIERRTSLPVERRLHLGGTFVCHRAITAGDIDIYVEYTGTAFTAILKQPPIASPDSVYRFVAADYAKCTQRPTRDDDDVLTRSRRLHPRRALKASRRRS